MKIYLSSKGLRPDHDNSRIINRQIELAKEGSVLMWPDGKFPVGSTILQNKTLHWEGSENTMLVASQPLQFAKFTGGYKSVIGRLNFYGSYSIYDKEGPVFDGIQVSAPIRMQDCLIRNVWGSAIACSADIATGAGNASKSRFQNLDIVECRSHGMYFQGGDANQCSAYDIDIRDCNGIGIWDNSFLGNNFYGCMTHACKEGSYKVGVETMPGLDNNNQRTNFYGCYAEEGQGQGELRDVIILCGSSRWYGGLAHKFSLHNFAKVYN